MKKVLVITYYWPPSGGGGVQRWLKFVKYLPDFGWEPIVFTPENQNAPSNDNTLMLDISPALKIIRRPIWEPYNLYRTLSGKKKEENLGAAFASERRSNKYVESLSNWVRSNFFIPDARKFWIRPSVSFLKEYIHKHDIDVVVTTGPPHSMHMIGLKLKKLTGVKWLADFRDPWTDIDYYDQLKLTKWANKKHHGLEREVLQNADVVVCVSDSNKEKLNRKAKSEIHVIPNGFDDPDVSFISFSIDEKFSLAHIGTFMANRNPEILWDVLSDMILENKEFRQDFILRLVGKIDSVILNNLTNKGLAPFVHTEEPVSHKEAVKLQKSAQVLLLTVNKTGNSKGMVTGKVFEYLVSGRPILAIGPTDGDLAKILKETETGVISDFNDKVGLQEKLESYYMQFKQRTLAATPKNTEKYSRRNLTKKMADTLNSLVK